MNKVVECRHGESLKSKNKLKKSVNMSIKRDMLWDDIESDITEILGGSIIKDNYIQAPYDAYEKSCGDLEICFFNEADFNKVWKTIHNKDSKYHWLTNVLIVEENNSMRFSLD